jgi:hypothetical protein
MTANVTINEPSHVRIRIGSLEFTARFEEKAAPHTCASFRSFLPLKRRVIHARWSGEAGWVPLGDFTLRSYENQTSYPSPGQILVYAFGISEPELLIPYGSCSFASKVGQLAGNHFLTIIKGNEQLAEFGRLVLWSGAQDITVEAFPV